MRRDWLPEGWLNAITTHKKVNETTHIILNHVQNNL